MGSNAIPAGKGGGRQPDDPNPQDVARRAADIRRAAARDAQAQSRTIPSRAAAPGAAYRGGEQPATSGMDPLAMAITGALVGNMIAEPSSGSDSSPSICDSGSSGYDSGGYDSGSGSVDSGSCGGGDW